MMIRSSLLFAVMALTAANAAAQSAFTKSTLTPFESNADLTPQTEIDKLVFTRLEKLGIQPARLCSDSVFVRRVFLDTIGTLPTEAEAKEFLQDRNPDKRKALIDKLLERDEFADYWSMKWSDLLRVKAEFPINLWPNAVQSYHRWIRASIKENKPYDRFARELLTSSGSNFRDAPVNFYRAVQSKEPVALAQTVALTFMGTRADSWPKERWASMSLFFSRLGFKATGEWKEEIIYFDSNLPVIPIPTASTPPARASATPSRALTSKAPATSAPATAPAPTFPDGAPARLAADVDPRETFADWLVNPKNPWFTRAISNRVWSWLLGRGIIHEPDDLRPDNPPVNPELLAYLEKELIGAKYDLKHLYRLILNSKTYQLSSIPRSDRPEGPANFSHYPLRRLEAEVLIDAICHITGSTEKYSSPIPEPFSFIPEEQRSIALADGSTTSSFLEMFGRPPRDTGWESERNNRPSADQRLHMLNSSHIQMKIENSSKLQAMMRPRNGGREMVENFYLTILSRYPSEEEMRSFGGYSRSGVITPRQAMQDLAWALINSAEFMYRH